MRAYYYLLYRLYTFYTITLNKSDQPLTNVSIVSSLLIWFNFIWIYGVFQLFGIFPQYSNYTIYAIILTALWLTNHFLLVKNEYFLKCNFKRDRAGGIGVVLFITLTITAFIITANENRERVFLDRGKASTEISEPIN